MTPWTIAHQAPLSMGFPRQEYWSGLLFPSPGDLSDSGMEPASPALAGRFFTTGAAPYKSLGALIPVFSPQKAQVFLQFEVSSLCLAPPWGFVSGDERPFCANPED